MKKMILFLLVLMNLAFSAEELTQAQIEYIEKECENGNLKYCTLIGEYYYLFGGIKIDYKKARYYFEKVCKIGEDTQKDESFIESCGNLGNIYYSGLGTAKNYKKAFKLYEMVCNAGSATACSNMGLMYQNGKGVKKDVAKGLLYMRKACDVGDWNGCRNFAAYHYGHGNKNEAALYFKKACELGRLDSSTQNNPNYKSLWQMTCSMYDVLK